MLETPGIQMRNVVVTRVIALDAVGKGEVERRKSEDGEFGQIRVVRQGTIYGGKH